MQEVTSPDPRENAETARLLLTTVPAAETDMDEGASTQKLSGGVEYLQTMRSGVGTEVRGERLSWAHRVFSHSPKGLELCLVRVTVADAPFVYAKVTFCAQRSTCRSRLFVTPCAEG